MGDLRTMGASLNQGEQIQKSLYNCCSSQIAPPDTSPTWVRVLSQCTTIQRYHPISTGGPTPSTDGDGGSVSYSRVVGCPRIASVTTTGVTLY